MAEITLASQVKCVEREIAIRKSVYPARVSARAMKQETADYEIAAMQAVLGTLKRLVWTGDACPDDCDHTIKEHCAFDEGAMAGERGEDDETCPYVDGDLREAWLTGHSVGSINRENRNGTTASKRA